jgi:hypothetical protein
MNLATRNAVYHVTGISEDGTSIDSQEYKDEATARALYNKWFGHYKTVLFCWRKPTVTKGQIDPDIF